MTSRAWLCERCNEIFLDWEWSQLGCEVESCEIKRVLVCPETEAEEVWYDDDASRFLRYEIPAPESA